MAGAMKTTPAALPTPRLSSLLTSCREGVFPETGLPNSSLFEIGTRKESSRQFATRKQHPSNPKNDPFASLRRLAGGVGCTVVVVLQSTEELDRSEGYRQNADLSGLR